MEFLPDREIKEVCLFDADTKDSGYSEDANSDLENLTDSPLSDLSAEERIVCFPLSEHLDDCTPIKNQIFSKKRLFGTPDYTKSPTQDTVVKFKRLKLFNSTCDGPEPDLLNCLTPTKKAKYDYASETTPRARNNQKDLVKEAVEKSEVETDLIGDFSKSYALPLIPGSHPDLKCISSNIMRDVLKGIYSSVLNSYTIIDCRYPYEYEGGHIEGALNKYTKEECLNLLEVPMKPTHERHILIFHCEFSMERGPSMSRLLREKDRLMNTSNYPNLIYPEIYVLEGGYKKFFENFPDLCVPREYTQMLHPDHKDDFRYFRKKSKSSDSIKNSKKNLHSRMMYKYRSETDI